MDRRRIRNLSLGALAGVVLVALIGAGGFPSRPKFQAVGINAAAPSTAGRVLINASASLDAIEVQRDGVTKGFLSVDSNGVGLFTDPLETGAGLYFNTTTDAASFLGANPVNFSVAPTIAGAADFARLSQANTFAAVQLGPDGTAGAPAWSFSSDPDSGLYRTSPNEVAISTNGAQRVRFASDAINLQSTAVQTNGVDATAASGTYVATVVGCTTSPTVTAVYRKMGNIVTLRVPPLTCTSNATSLSFSGAPALITPTTGDASTVQTAYGAINNGVTEYGLIACNMATTGAVVCARNSSQTGFTASGSKGFGNALQLTYGLL